MPGYVYILTNDAHTVLYTGVTSNLPRRLQQHRDGQPGSFTHRYRVKRLVYVEYHSSIWHAIQREKQIKGGSRRMKEALINELNPVWRDLADDPDYNGSW